MTMDKELLYNQSGIKDETAYKAIANLQRGGATMNGTEISAGEIWEVGGDYSRYVVALKCFDRYVAIITLREQQPAENAVPIRVHSIMYADAGRLGYAYYDNFINFVRLLTPEENAGLRTAIYNALDLVTENISEEIEYVRQGYKYELEQAEKVVEQQAKDLEEASKEIKALQEELKGINQPAVTGVTELVEESGIREELAAARKEAEIYKGLYENMLARALG